MFGFLAHPDKLASNISFDNEKNKYAITAVSSAEHGAGSQTRPGLRHSPVNWWISSVTLSLNSSSGRDSIYSDSCPAIQPQRMKLGKDERWKSFRLIYLWSVRCAASAVATADLSEGLCTVKADIFLIQFFLRSVTWSRMASLKTWNIHHGQKQNEKQGLSFFIWSLKQLAVMSGIYCGWWMCCRPHLSTTGRWFHSLCPTRVHQIPNTLCCMCQILGFEWSAPCVEGVVDGTELNNASWGILPKWCHAG